LGGRLHILRAILLAVLALSSGCARPLGGPAPPVEAPVARSTGVDAPDHPDTLALGRRLIVDTRADLLRALVDRLADRVRLRPPVDSLALVRIMELWSEQAAQPRARPDSSAAAWARVAVRV